MCVLILGVIECVLVIKPWLRCLEKIDSFLFSHCQVPQGIEKANIPKMGLNNPKESRFSHFRLVVKKTFCYQALRANKVNFCYYLYYTFACSLWVKINLKCLKIFTQKIIQTNTTGSPSKFYTERRT